jgi:hypothetical protein
MIEFQWTNTSDDKSFQDLIQSCPNTPDLTNEKHADWVENASNTLVYICKNKETALKLEDAIFNSSIKLPALLLLALKNATSRFYCLDIKKPLKISIVFAIYKENHRMLEKSQHPYGEDFITRKVNQMQWLFKDMNHIEWKLIIVDDGCPENSGKIAEEIISRKKLPNVQVLYLQNAIDQKLALTKPMQSTNDSQKGGSIAYGMWYASQQKTNKKHIILFTDADLSTHLGQTGLLLHPIIKNGKKSAIASRREKKSVTIKQGGRNNRGKLFIYLWKRMIPNLNYVIDTQCGFKAFESTSIREIIEDLIEKKFAFDIELLLKTELLEPHSIEKVAVAWIDSEAASTTTDIQPYLPMLKSITMMQKKYLKPNENALAFADFIQSLDEEKFHELLDHIPEEITKREPIEFNDYHDISADDLKIILE